MALLSLNFRDGANWFNAVGYANVNVLDYLNISFGRDKNFWGDGIRSLFLSDNSAPYLFLKEKVTFWRIEYISMITQLTQIIIIRAINCLTKIWLLPKAGHQDHLLAEYGPL